ncbi:MULTISPECIES: kynureninase [Gammaproteobacteria]|uniref:kynureninase n=1 Tax=Gammaproteobacteria TaxID=1236 RepID=UPI000DD0D8E2|nr:MULTISPECIES: kynureninase [Gammaproteobacteria]RTE85809.1 kynureninase [Aliidiomarina sp. B3213]TCZ90189.1 kynureninase [Lysobacter sp. N42]
MLSRLEIAQQLDREDPLFELRHLFHIPAQTVYLDGNSLGPLSYSAQERIAQTTQQEWGNDLIASWNKHSWISKPQQVGDRIGKLVGASEGQTLCCDSISINLFKVLVAALEVFPGDTIVSTEDNFPTDLYMIQGLQKLLEERNIKLELVAENELENALSRDVAALLVTHVNFRTGAMLNIERLAQLAHKNNAAIIVDLAHSAGAVPVYLDDWQVDFAVGCTYKYLNAGPGAPAFVYVAERHLGKAYQPLFGWMGHAAPFEFSPEYVPAQDISQFLVGTPPIVSMSAVEGALDVFEQTSIPALREKSVKLSEAFEQALAEKGLNQELQSISPTDSNVRGSQLSFHHEDAYAICQAWIHSGVIADYRAPSYLRVGFAPLYVGFEDLFVAIEKLEHIMRNKTYKEAQFQVKQKVT